MSIDVETLSWMQGNQHNICKISTIKDVRNSYLTRETLAMDLKGPFPSGEHLLVIIDYRSRYPIPALLDTITSTEIIKKLEEVQKD